jgi:hypothetical protein
VRKNVPFAGTAGQRPQQANTRPPAGLQNDFASDERESACKAGVFREAADDRRNASPESVRPDADGQGDCRDQKGLQIRAFCEAAEGIRTLDLLHGKQELRLRLCVECSCKVAGFRAGRGSLQTPAFIGKPRGFPDRNRTELGSSEARNSRKRRGNEAARMLPSWVAVG